MAGPVFDRRSFAVWYIYICIGLEFKGCVAVEDSLLKHFSTEMESLNKSFLPQKISREVKSEDR